VERPAVAHRVKSRSWSSQGSSNPYTLWAMPGGLLFRSSFFVPALA
jgi:hypothetical protein